MKILYIANIHLPSHKAHAFQIMKTCESFVKIGHEVELIIPKRKNLIAEDPFLFYGIQTTFPITKLFSVELGWKGDFPFFTQSFSFAGIASLYASSKKYDVIYCRDEQVLAPMSAILGTKKIAWETHTGSWNRCARFFASKIAAIVTISQGGRDFYVQKGVMKDVLCVAPSGVDVVAFSSPQSMNDARIRLGLPIEKKIILYAGHLESWRGASTFFDAADLLSSEYEFVAIGGDSEISALKAKYSRVLFLGYRPYVELSDNMSAADMLVLPNTGKNDISSKFTSPLKLMAYMTSGKPIIASDLPSIREIVSDKEAYFVEPDNSKALANGITFLSENPLYAKELAQNALVRVREYDWITRAERIATCLSKQLSIRAQSGSV